MITLTPVGDPLSTSEEVLEGYDVVFEILPRHKRNRYPDLTEVGGAAVGVRMAESEDEEVRMKRSAMHFFTIEGRIGGW